MADGRIVGELTHEDASEEVVLRMITSASRHEVVVGGGQ
jgi:hypothetical protein